MEELSNLDLKEVAVIYKENWIDGALASGSLTCLPTTWQPCECRLNGISSEPINTQRTVQKPAANLSPHQKADSSQGINFWMISGNRKNKGRFNHRLKFHWIPMQIPSMDKRQSFTAPTSNPDLSKSFLDLLQRDGKKQALIFLAVREYIEQIGVAKNRSDVDELPIPTIELVHNEFCGLHWRVDKMEIFPARERTLDATGTALLKWSSHGELRKDRGIRVDLTGSARLCVIKGAVRKVDHFNFRVTNVKRSITTNYSAGSYEAGAITI